MSIEQYTPLAPLDHIRAENAINNNLIECESEFCVHTRDCLFVFYSSVCVDMGFSVDISYLRAYK